MITRLSLLCKNFNVAHYSKSIKDTNTKLVMLSHHEKMQLQHKGHNSESYIFGVMLLLELNIFEKKERQPLTDESLYRIRCSCINIPPKQILGLLCCVCPVIYPIYLCPACTLYKSCTNFSNLAQSFISSRQCAESILPCAVSRSASNLKVKYQTLSRTLVEGMNGKQQ